jgi:hypothetical protein
MERESLVLSRRRTCIDVRGMNPSPELFRLVWNLYICTATVPTFPTFVSSGELSSSRPGKAGKKNKGDEAEGKVYIESN